MLALIALSSLLPVMFLVAFLVRLTSRGPVLYTQVRVGLDRRSRLPANKIIAGSTTSGPALHHL